MGRPEISLHALRRARALIEDLDLSRRPVDIAQVVAGLKQELDTAAIGLVHYMAEEHHESYAAPRPPVLASGTQRSRILEHIAHMGEHGATDHELQADLTIGISSERRRRGELVHAGLVRAGLLEETLRTRVHQGQPWTVWEVTDEGKAALLRIGAGEQIPLLRV